MNAAAPVGVRVAGAAVGADHSATATLTPAAMRRRRRMGYPLLRTARDVPRVRPSAASARAATNVPLAPASGSAVSKPALPTVLPALRLPSVFPLRSCHRATSVAPFQLT